MILLHAHRRTAYDEIKDELESARKNGYMLIAVQWLNKETRGVPGCAGRQHAGRSHVALCRGRKYRANPDKVALSGFSRGGAVSYETAWRDAQEHRHFKLVICHSGGVPLDAVIRAAERLAAGPVFQQAQ